MLGARLRGGAFDGGGGGGGGAFDGGGGGGGGGIPTDYIVFYTMDNISGSTLVDETGTYPGTITGAVQDTGCKGQALKFEGITNARVSLPLAAQITDTMTVSFRCKKGSPSLNVLSTASSGISNQFSALQVTSAGAVRVLRHTGSSYAETVSAESGFPDCSRFTVRWSSGVLSVMVNGAWLSFPNGSRNLAENPDIDRVDIGAIVRAAITNDGGGWLDEMYIYDYALTDAECLALDGV